MSTRTIGMVGKTFNSIEEAFKDASYATAIQRPTTNRFDWLGAFLFGLFVSGVFGYGFYLTISRHI